jgi:hypothetical protein
MSKQSNSALNAFLVTLNLNPAHFRLVAADKNKFSLRIKCKASRRFDETCQAVLSVMQALGQPVSSGSSRTGYVNTWHVPKRGQVVIDDRGLHICNGV